MSNETPSPKWSLANLDQTLGRLERSDPDDFYIAVASELGLLRACFETLAYTAPEETPLIQARIDASLKRLAKCALIPTNPQSITLSPLTEFEVTELAKRFTGSISQLVRDTAEAQRSKSDFEINLK